jgi:thioredoxin 2
MATLSIDDKGVLVKCQNCGTTNRLAHERLAATVRCGRCKQPLALPPTPLEAASSADFQLLISKASIPIVVDYWAPWCGPCRMVAPQLEKVAARANGRFLIVKVNTDALPDLGERYAIRSIPTLAVLVLGREVARTAGARPADDIEAFVTQAIANAFASNTAH